MYMVTGFYNFDGLVCRYEMDVFTHDRLISVPKISKIWYISNFLCGTWLTLHAGVKIADPYVRQICV